MVNVRVRVRMMGAIVHCVYVVCKRCAYVPVCVCVSVLKALEMLEPQNALHVVKDFSVSDRYSAHVRSRTCLCVMSIYNEHCFCSFRWRRAWEFASREFPTGGVCSIRFPAKFACMYLSVYPRFI